ncbi:MAG: FtsW/RodA/SpoVE family cell cycle protein [Bacteroidales bacterium]|nr:FtsW/RodA/SpoVE family cell cycle protein [Bacteroidales bacterium]
MAKRFRKLHGDQIIWLVILLLALISIVAVYSSSSALAYKNETSTFTYLFKQMGYVSIGFIALLICYRIPLSWYRKGSILLLLFSAGLLLYIVFKGVVLNHAARWIQLGPLSFQPSELAKIAVILYLARILETHKFYTFKEYIIWILVPLGAVCILSLIGSVSATLIIGVTAFVILICAGINWKYIAYTVGIVIVALSLVFLVHKAFGTFSRLDTFTARIERFFSPEDVESMSAEEKQEYKEKNFQSEQAKQAIQLGGLTGRGPGNSLKKDTLPHPYSDFIFALIVEELGLFGGLFLIMLYLWFFSRCITIAKLCTKMYSTVVVLGLGFLITLQAFIHILVNVGIFPVTGQTLPLVSLGGTSLLIMSCAFGIILSVNRTIEIKIEIEKSKNE